MRSTHPWIGRSAALAVLMLGFATAAAADEPIADGKQVSIEYTLTVDDDEKPVDSNVGKEPLVYTQGSGQIVPGLERELVGLKAGDTKKVEVAAKDGYGEVDSKRMHEVPLENIPEEARKAGTVLQGQTPAGQPIVARVAEVKDETIVVDMNHPLAGKKLFFEVKVLKVEDGTNTPSAPKK